MDEDRETAREIGKGPGEGPPLRRANEIVRKRTISLAQRDPTPSLRILPPLYRAGHLSASLVRALFDDIAPAGDGLILLELGRRDGQAPAALARALGVQRSSATAMIQRVCDYGLVREALNLRDRRSRVLELTRMGAAAARVGGARVHGVEQRILRSLHADDLEILERIVTAVAEARIISGDVD